VASAIQAAYMLGLGLGGLLGGVHPDPGAPALFGAPENRSTFHSIQPVPGSPLPMGHRENPDLHPEDIQEVCVQTAGAGVMTFRAKPSRTRSRERSASVESYSSPHSRHTSVQQRHRPVRLERDVGPRDREVGVLREAAAEVLGLVKSSRGRGG